MALIPWHDGKNVTRDVTVTDTDADSCLHFSAACASSVAEGAASRKETNYAALDHSYTFISLAFETYGTINDKGTKFVQELGRRLRAISDDPRESAFLRQTHFHYPAVLQCHRFFDTFTPASETEFEA